MISDFKQTHGGSGHKSVRQLELIDKCIQSTIDSICLKYHSNASDLLESVRKMEDNLRMLQRVRKTNLATTANTVSDDDKIRIQLYLDVVEFGRLCAEKFNGYRGESNYDALLKLVEDARANQNNANNNINQSSSSSLLANANNNLIGSSSVQVNDDSNMMTTKLEDNSSEII